MLPTEPVSFEDAVMLFRVCRSGGDQVRELIDCLIAAVAIRADVPVLHRDNEFDAMARQSALRTILTISWYCLTN